MSRRLRPASSVRSPTPETASDRSVSIAVSRGRSWIAAATDRAILRRSVVTCLIVGAILTAINQGDALVRGEFDSAMAWKIGLTFLVPLVVATMSGAAAIRVHLRDDHRDARTAGHASAPELGAEAHAHRRV
jgi:hypothetical protein